ncbi:MAG: hypothetical protein LBV40_05365 [Methanomicrobiales archaeon]|jgi:hypothetical protein|nr:hypothetical protein [Methanomicrobiales archaeon]
MTKLENLIADLCPDGVEYVSIGTIADWYHYSANNHHVNKMADFGSGYHREKCIFLLHFYTKIIRDRYGLQS